MVLLLSPWTSDSVVVAVVEVAASASAFGATGSVSFAEVADGSCGTAVLDGFSSSVSVAVVIPRAALLD